MESDSSHQFELNRRLARVLREERPNTVGYQIASVLIYALPLLQDLSIGEVAERCAVSKSTLSKFVRVLGFEDYASFKDAAAAYWQRETYYIPSGVNITDYLCGNGVSSYLDFLTRDFKALATHTEPRTLAHVVDLLHNCRQIGAFGSMYGHTAALNLFNKMAFYRRFVFVSDNEEKICQFLEAANQTDVVMLYSNSGFYLDGYGETRHGALRNAMAHTEAHVVLVNSNLGVLSDPRVDTCLLLPSNPHVRNYPFFVSNGQRAHRRCLSATIRLSRRYLRRRPCLTNVSAQHSG